MSTSEQREWIPNIILGQDYDRRYIDDPIHYDALENLAVFFGRDMPVHRHAQYLQLHYIDRGDLCFHIDDKIYRAQGPALVLTPPSVPHSFLTRDDACGHVLTLHQSLLWQLLKSGVKHEYEHEICIAFNDLNEQETRHWFTLVETLENIRDEWQQSDPSRDLALQTLVILLLITVGRLTQARTQSTSVNVNIDDLQSFRMFSNLIQDHYREHWQLTEYTRTLGLSESRLHLICRRIANRSPKKIIHDHLIQEAKRLLTFSDLSCSDIGYQLGFSDPAYFARFFKRHTGVTSQQFRQQQR